jgi:hypothetical protein
MNLYHGSNMEIRAPKIIKSKRLLDFGTGFYLTSDFEQAQKWATRTTNRREAGTPIVSMFYIAIQLLLPQNLKDQHIFKTEKALSILKFAEVKRI